MVTVENGKNLDTQICGDKCAPRLPLKRGFAAMEANYLREVSRRGGVAVHQKGTAHEFDSDEARRAGKKGGEVVSRDRSHMAEIGRRGAATRYNSNIEILVCLQFSEQNRSE
jgi:general stress protein YciG